MNYRIIIHLHLQASKNYLNSYVYFLVGLPTTHGHMQLLTMGHTKILLLFKASQAKKGWEQLIYLRHLPKNGQDSICHCLNPHYTADSTISHEASDSVKIADQILARALAKITIERECKEAALWITIHTEHVNYLLYKYPKSWYMAKHSIITSRLIYLYPVSRQIGTQRGMREDRMREKPTKRKKLVVTSPLKISHPIKPCFK